MSDQTANLLELHCRTLLFSHCCWWPQTTVADRLGLYHIASSVPSFFPLVSILFLIPSLSLQSLLHPCPHWWLKPDKSENFQGGWISAHHFSHSSPYTKPQSWFASCVQGRKSRFEIYTWHIMMVQMIKSLSFWNKTMPMWLWNGTLDIEMSTLQNLANHVHFILLLWLFTFHKDNFSSKDHPLKSHLWFTSYLRKRKCR